MDRKKLIYIGLLLIVTIFSLVTYFSYAFFAHTDEYHGKLNVVVGTLDYKLTSTLLDNNNSITLAAYEKARLNIEVESLNKIDSKYELYYTTTNNNIEIGYDTTNDLPTGTINAKSKKIVTVIIKNATNTSATITFGVQGGFTHNTLVLDTRRISLGQIQSVYCDIAVNTTFDFDYTGNSQEFDVPCSGNYKVELWGAEGGFGSADTVNYIYPGGQGAYTSGNITLNNSEKIYVYVGGRGTDAAWNYENVSQGGYNGGGTGGFDETTSNGSDSAGGGGGATDIRISNGVWNQFSSLKTRIMVAAGGGGGSWNSTTTSEGQNGSGLFIKTRIINGGNSSRTEVTDGTQTSGYKFGIAMDRNITSGTGPASGGGGGGYYTGYLDSEMKQGPGGTSFISGYSGCNAIDQSSTENTITHKNSPNYDDTHIFTNGVMIDGQGCDWSTGIASNCGSNQFQPDGTMSTGHSGNGYARITYLSESTEEEKANIKYIVTFDANGGSVSQTSKEVSY